MTPWNEYRDLKNSDFKGMRKKNLLDTRRLLSTKKLKLNYTAIGIGS